MTTIQIKHSADSENVLAVMSDDGSTLLILPGETLDTLLRGGATLTLRHLRTEEAPQ